KIMPTNRVDPQTLIGVKVKVHFNLHTHLWSITAIGGEHAGRVIANVNTITLTNVDFKVSAAGRARCHRLGKRTVHAWVVGVVESIDQPVATDQLTKATYNPSADRADTFTTPEGSPVLHAPRASFARSP